MHNYFIYSRGDKRNMICLFYNERSFENDKLFTCLATSIEGSPWIVNKQTFECSNHTPNQIEDLVNNGYFVEELGIEENIKVTYDPHIEQSKIETLKKYVYLLNILNAYLYEPVKIEGHIELKKDPPSYLEDPGPDIKALDQFITEILGVADNLVMISDGKNMDSELKKIVRQHSFRKFLFEELILDMGLDNNMKYAK